jgi:hypothetical protein
VGHPPTPLGTAFWPDLTWGLSACALGLDEVVDVSVHTTAFKREPHFFIELEEGEQRLEARLHPMPTLVEVWPLCRFEPQPGSPPFSYRNEMPWGVTAPGLPEGSERRLTTLFPEHLAGPM